MSRLYVAGPMTGLPGHNYATFRAAAHTLTGRGYDVECPTTVSDNDPAKEPKPWDWYMRRTLAMLLTCDAVALLDGWEHSRGARLEVEVAHALGMMTLPWHRWLDAGEETR